MRIQYSVFLFLIIAGMACERNNVTLKGSVEHGEGKAIILERLDVNRTSVIDSTSVDNKGHFILSTKINEPALLVLRYVDGQIINLLAAPGESIVLSSHDKSFSKDYSVEGSEESENIRILVQQLNHTRAVLDSLEKVALVVEDPESPQMKVIRDAYAQTIVNQKRFTIRYLLEHMHSLSSVYALYQKYDPENPVMGLESDLQYFKVVADSLEVSHPNSSLTKSLRADISQRENNVNTTNKMNTLLEMAEEPKGSLELSIPDREGRVITLSDFQGKVVLVVFWASGNEASINALLQLKSTYDRYHNKGFEIYSISLDNDKYSWMNAMDFNEFNWINVSELSYPESKANMIYNVTSLPSSFLINREGDIVAKNLFGRTLETWLDNLL